MGTKNIILILQQFNFYCGIKTFNLSNCFDKLQFSI